MYKFVPWKDEFSSSNHQSSEDMVVFRQVNVIFHIGSTSHPSCWLVTTRMTIDAHFFHRDAQQKNLHFGTGILGGGRSNSYVIPKRRLKVGHWFSELLQQDDAYFQKRTMFHHYFAWWWFRNPANQLRWVVYPIISRVLYIPGGDRRISEPSTVPSHHTKPHSQNKNHPKKQKKNNNNIMLILHHVLQ